MSKNSINFEAICIRFESFKMKAKGGKDKITNTVYKDIHMYNVYFACRMAFIATNLIDYILDAYHE